MKAWTISSSLVEAWITAAVFGPLLIVAGCQKKYPPPGNLSPEMRKAVSKGDATFVHRQLAAHLVNPDDEDPVDGLTGMALAANNGDLEMVKVFVEAGGDVNHLKNASSPSNPLWQAQDYPDTYKYLLAHGAKKPDSIMGDFVLGINAKGHR